MREATQTMRPKGGGHRGWLGSAQSRFLGTTALLISGVLLSGCHVDMWNQSKMKPFYQSDFFADQSANRPLVEHTVPVGPIQSADPAYYTGFVSGKLVPKIPVEAVRSFQSPKEMILRGQIRYNAYCSPCHGKTGDGNGFIMQRGLGYWQKLAASYHTDRLRKIQDGHIYDVLTNGYGVMYSYGSRIQDVNDRWAIVAYVRALQLTRPSEAPVPESSTPLENSLGTERPVNRTPGGISTQEDNVPGVKDPALTASPSPGASPEASASPTSDASPSAAPTVEATPPLPPAAPPAATPPAKIGAPK